MGIYQKVHIPYKTKEYKSLLWEKKGLQRKFNYYTKRKKYINDLLDKTETEIEKITNKLKELLSLRK